MSILTGVVRSGFGFASRDPAGLIDLVRENSGLRVRPGTLNVVLESPRQIDPDFVLEAARIRERAKLPPGWARDYAVQRCTVNGLACLIMRPSNSVHDDHILEVMADVHLRTALGLADGSPVEVLVSDKVDDGPIEKQPVKPHEGGRSR